MSDRKPDHDKTGLPLHTDECPEYDGKRCKEMGFPYWYKAATLPGEALHNRELPESWPK